MAASFCAAPGKNFDAALAFNFFLHQAKWFKKGQIDKATRLPDVLTSVF
jgi:hypothetical protein